MGIVQKLVGVDMLPQNIEQAYDTILDFFTEIASRGRFEELSLDGIPRLLRLSQELLTSTYECDTIYCRGRRFILHDRIHPTET
jgi:hypothetical protein